MEVDLDSVEEGQILSQPVMNNFGQVILPSATVLTARHIVVLKTWKIGSVQINRQGEEDQEEYSYEGENILGESEQSDFNDDIVKAATERLAGKLNWIPENEFEQELYDMGLRRACEIIKRRGGK